MDSLCVAARSLLEPASGASGRCRERRLQADVGERDQQRAQQGRLAGTGTAGDHGDAAGESASQRALLLDRQFEFRRFDRGRDRAIDQILVHRAARVQFRDSRGDVHFGLVQAREVNRDVIVGLFGDHLAAGGKLVDGVVREVGFHVERGAELAFQILERRIDVALVGHAFEDVEDGGARALDRVARDTEFLGDRVGGAESDAVNRAREDVRIALDDVERVLAVELVDAARVRGGQSVAAQENRQLAQPRRVAPCRRNRARDCGADAGNFAHPLRRVVEHFAERVAEVLRDAPREPWADAFYFRSEVALYREGSGGAQRFEIHDLELLAEALMILEAAERAYGRTDFEACEIADDGDAAKVAMLLGHDDDGDRVAGLVVGKENLIEDALESLGRLLRLCHGKRITRAARRVQLMTTRASTGDDRN